MKVRKWTQLIKTIMIKKNSSTTQAHSLTQQWKAGGSEGERDDGLTLFSVSAWLRVTWTVRRCKETLCCHAFSLFWGGPENVTIRWYTSRTKTERTDPLKHDKTSSRQIDNKLSNDRPVVRQSNHFSALIFFKGTSNEAIVSFDGKDATQTCSTSYWMRTRVPSSRFSASVYQTGKWPKVSREGRWKRRTQSIRQKNRDNTKLKPIDWKRLFTYEGKKHRQED